MRCIWVIYFVCCLCLPFLLLDAVGFGILHFSPTLPPSHPHLYLLDTRPHQLVSSLDGSLPAHTPTLHTPYQFPLFLPPIPPSLLLLLAFTLVLLLFCLPSSFPPHTPFGSLPSFYFLHFGFCFVCMHFSLCPLLHTLPVTLWFSTTCIPTYLPSPYQSPPTHLHYYSPSFLLLSFSLVLQVATTYSMCLFVLLRFGTFGFWLGFIIWFLSFLWFSSVYLSVPLSYSRRDILPIPIGSFLLLHLTCHGSIINLWFLSSGWVRLPKGIM